MQVRDAVSRTEVNIEIMRSKLDKREDLEILEWITGIDYGPQQTDYIRRRQVGTGQWFLDSEQYQAWLKTDEQTLFCSGIPGAGKTILMATVIEDLTKRFAKDKTVGIAYVYFNFKHRFEEQPKELLSSLLRQLVVHQAAVPNSVRELYDKHHDKRTRPSLEEVSIALRSVAALYLRVFVIIDALDECQFEGHCRSTFLAELYKLPGISKLITSRPIPDIEALFKGCPSLEILASDEDISIYLDGRMKLLPSFMLDNQELRKQIKSEIISAVEGM